MIFWQNTNTGASGRILENGRTIYEVTRESLNNLINTIFDRLPYIVAGLLVVLLFWFLAKFAKKIFWSASGKTRLDNRLRILFGRLLFVTTFVLGIFAALTVIIPSFGFGDLITGLGFTSFVIGFATKDILNNLLSGVLILWQQPFRIGDYLFVGSNQGKVEEIGVRATKLRKDDGEAVLIPNGDMYSSALTIRGAGAERRMLIKLNIDYGSDIDQAKSLIMNLLKSVEGVGKNPQPNTVVTDLTSDGINLSTYFWINTDLHSPQAVFDRVATGIKKVLGEANIVIFPPGSIVVESNTANNDASNENVTPPTDTKKKTDEF